VYPEVTVFGKLNHVAIVSDNYALLSVWYRALFDLKFSPHAKFEASAQAVGDGYVGMNVNPRMPGRQAGLDHFGIQVDDVDLVRERVAKKYPKVQIVQRPSNRPFAALGIHDPVGNYFDLSQKGLKNRGEVYEKPSWDQPRTFSHFALRAVDPEMLATFYSEIFELPVTANDGTYALSDGRITMVILPWRIDDFLGTGIERPALDHIGFEVESVAAFENDLEQLVLTNPLMRPKPLGAGPESAIRKQLFERTSLGKVYLSDPDGVLLAIKEKAA
jgi:predicted enzyme related to lactoylglutathione lyase